MSEKQEMGDKDIPRLSENDVNDYVLDRFEDVIKSKKIKNLVSFQGPNGNLTQPLWRFRARGGTGKMISDLVPCLGDMAICTVYVDLLLIS